MTRYEVTGVPIGSSLLTGHAVGAVIALKLTDEEEADLVGAGAIRPLQEKPQEKPKSDAEKQNS